MKSVELAAVNATLVQRVVNLATRGHTPAEVSRAWRINNPYSTVWCLEVATAGHSSRYFAKTANAHVTDLGHMRRALGHEYETLSRLNARASEYPAGTGCVIVAAYFDDIPALVTHAASGSTLRARYAKGARVWSTSVSRQELIRAAALAGAWLATFQSHTASGTGPLPADDLMGYLDVRLQRLRAKARSRDLVLTLDQLESSVRSLAESSDTRVCASCLRHNDFASHNIIFDPSAGLRVLDFQAADTGAAAFDACNFWLELEWLKFDPSYCTSTLGRLQSAFLESYGRVPLHEPAFRLARLRYTVNRLLNELDCPSVLRLSLRWRRSVASSQRWLQAFTKSDSH